jgi:hypothetical protein
LEVFHERFLGGVGGGGRLGLVTDVAARLQPL